MIPSTRPRKRRTPTTRQQQNNEAAERIVSLWRSMTPTQKFVFARLGPFVPDWNGTRSARPLPAYQTFQAICRGLQAANLELTKIAPQTVDLPPFLPDLTLTATQNSSGHSLRLTPDEPYPFPCQIWATWPHMQYTEKVAPNKFLVIASCSSLPAEGVDLRAAFLSTYPDFLEGHKLMLRVCPISPSGFRGQTVPVDGVVEKRYNHAMTPLLLTGMACHA